MPRERITGKDGDVQVGWSPHGSMQIGVETAKVFVVDPDGRTSLWSGLDRKGCNDLIRVLRRARDSAFGRDE